MIPLEHQDLGAIARKIAVESDALVVISERVDPSETPPHTSAFGKMLLGSGTR